MKVAAAITAVLLATAFGRAEAQLPFHISVAGGVAGPVQNEGDLYDKGFHLNGAFKMILIPVQVEASYDRLSSRGTGDALSTWALGAAFPLEITPAIIPIGVYVIPGVGVYRHGAGVNDSDLGINAGAGVRIKPLPMFQPFIEGRGVMIFRDNNAITYFTAAAGIRF